MIFIYFVNLVNIFMLMINFDNLFTTKTEEQLVDHIITNYKFPNISYQFLDEFIHDYYIFACKYKCYKVIKTLLDTYPKINVNFCTYLGLGALGFLCWDTNKIYSNKVYKIVKLLIKKGIDLNYYEVLAKHSSFIFARTPYIEAFKLMVDNGLNLNILDDDGCDILTYANIMNIDKKIYLYLQNIK